MLLGVAREKITPEIGGQLYGYNPDVRSTSLADDLTVTAFYFVDGDKKALLITATVCLIKTEYANELLDRVSKQSGIEKSNIILAATHTHSGPNMAGQTGWGDRDVKYCEEIFSPALLASVKAAMANPVKVKMAAVTGESKLGINRRELYDNNYLALGQNPWGPYDPTMTLLSFADESGKIIANLIHYGCHGTCAGVNTEITRDWSGIMTDAVEDKSGAITAFFNGPEGDVGPRISNGKTVGDLCYVYELGKVAAKDAVKLFDKLGSFEEVSLKTHSGEIKVPMASRISLEEAEALYKKYEIETVNSGAMIKAYALSVIEAHKNGEPEIEYTGFTQNLIALGNFVFASTPYELFSAIGMRTDRHFKDLKILNLSNSNGSEGYFVTEEAIPLGGYEVSMFLYGQSQPYCKFADFELFKAMVKNIENLED